MTWLRGATQKLMSLIKINSYVNGILSIEGLTGNGCTTEYDIFGHKNNSLVKKNSKHFRFEIWLSFYIFIQSSSDDDWEGDKYSLKMSKTILSS